MVTVSKREDYGIALMVDLFKNFGKRLVPLSEIAKTHSISLLFLRNIAADLRKSGLIMAVEGRKGGYKLSKNPKDIQFGDVLRSLWRKPIFSCCQNTPDGRCHISSCPHGFSLRRLNNEFLEDICNLSLRRVLENAYHRKP